MSAIIGIGTGSVTAMHLLRKKDHFHTEDMVNQLLFTHLPNSGRQLQHAWDSKAKRTQLIYQILNFLYCKGKSLEYTHVLRNNSKLDIFVGILVSEKTTVTLHFRLNIITSVCSSYWMKPWHHYDVALLTGRNICIILTFRQ